MVYKASRSEITDAYPVISPHLQHEERLYFYGDEVKILFGLTEIMQIYHADPPKLQRFDDSTFTERTIKGLFGIEIGTGVQRVDQNDGEAIKRLYSLVDSIDRAVTEIGISPPEQSTKKAHATLCVPNGLVTPQNMGTCNRTEKDIAETICLLLKKKQSCFTPTTICSSKEFAKSRSNRLSCSRQANPRQQ